MCLGRLIQVAVADAKIDRRHVIGTCVGDDPLQGGFDIGQFAAARETLKHLQVNEPRVDRGIGHNIGDLRPIAEDPRVAAVIVTIGEVVIINYIAIVVLGPGAGIYDHDRMPFSRKICRNVALFCKLLLFCITRP